MLAGGAKDSTQTQLFQKLGIKDTSDTVGMLSALQSESLSVANAVFGDRSFEISPHYATYVKGFDAHVDATSKTLAENVDRLNSWISGHTRGLIQNMLSKGMLAHSHLVLINALAFKAAWATKFDPSNTVKNFKFQVAAKKTCPVDMMFVHNQRKDLHDGKGYTAVRLPFAISSGKMSLIAYLPSTSSSIAELLPTLRLDTIKKSFKATKLSRFGIPKFDIKTSVQILDLLKQLDFPLVNNFPKMGTGENLVDQIVHSSAVKLDEKGAEAAAATAVIMTRSRPLNVRELVFDRPFAFVIVEDELDLVLFAGVITGG